MQPMLITLNTKHSLRPETSLVGTFLFSFSATWDTHKGLLTHKAPFSWPGVQNQHVCCSPIRTLNINKKLADDREYTNKTISYIFGQIGKLFLFRNLTACGCTLMFKTFTWWGAILRSPTSRICRPAASSASTLWKKKPKSGVLFP